MLILGLNEAIDQMVLANSIHLCDRMMMREHGHVLMRAFDFEVDGQR